MIDFTLTPSQHQLRTAASSFRTTVLSTARDSYDTLPTQTERFRALRPTYRKAVEAGLVAGQVPKALGGTGGALIDAALLVEEIYHGDPSAALAVLGTGLGLLPLIFGGNEEQHTTFLEPFLNGNGEPLASLVHSEPQGTANWLEKGAHGLRTTARQEGDEWIINGEKLWTTNSGGWDNQGADLQCVVCRASPTSDPQDPSTDPRDAILILLVTRETIRTNAPDTYRVLRDPELAGHTAASGPHSIFTNLRVPASHVLARPGRGAQIVEQAFAASASLVGAMAVSIMRGTFEAALAFAKSDARGGTVPIIEHQSVADLLIDIKMRIETSRLLTWKALDCLENGPGDARARLEMGLECKIFCSDNAVKACVDAMKVVGMTSYSKDMPFSRLLNDAVCLPLFDGGNVGIRRRQLERVFKEPDYKPWAATFGV